MIAAVNRFAPFASRASRGRAWSWLAGLAGLVGTALLVTPSLRAAAPTAEVGEVVLLRASSIVHPVLAEYLREGIAEADAAGAKAVILELDTPGGLMESAREITTAMLSARTPVVVWVGPNGARAASAGFFLLMAADVAAMAPETNTGAAHPVDGGGGDIEGHMGKKVEEDAAAQIRALAGRNGRNVELAEAAVKDSRSFTAAEALANRLIEVQAPDLPALLKALDGRTVPRGEERRVLETSGATVREIEMPAFRRVLSTIAHPNIALALLILGGLGLYFELMHPGAILPGVVGAICLVLAFWGLSVLPIRAAGVALVLLAVVFFIAEIKVTSYGLLTVAGVLSLTLGSLLLFKSPEPALRASRGLIAILALAAGAGAGAIAWLVLRARRLPVRSGREGLLAATAVARTPLAPEGKVFVQGEIWSAVASVPVAVGESVEVVRVEDMTLHVRPLRPADLGA